VLPEFIKFRFKCVNCIRQKDTVNHGSVTLETTLKLDDQTAGAMAWIATGKGALGAGPLLRAVPQDKNSAVYCKV